MSKTRHSAFLIAARILALGLQFFALPLYIRYLGAPGYEIVVFGTVIVNYLGLINFGVHGATQRRVAELAHQGDSEGYAYELSQGFAVVVALQVVSFFIAWAGFVVFDAADIALRGLTLPTFLYLALQFGFNQHFIFSSCILSATDRFKTISVLNAIQSIATVGLSILFVVQAPTPESLALGMMLGSAFSSVLAVFASNSARDFLRGVKLWGRGISKDLVQIGKRFYVASVASTVALTADRLLVGARAPQGALAAYAVGAKLPDVLFELMRPITQTVHPELIRRQIDDEKGFARDIIRHSLLALAMGCSLIAVPCAFATCILSVWFGGEVLPSADHVAFGLGLTRAFDLGLSMITVAFFARGEPHRLIGYTWFRALFVIALSIPALHYFGLMGVAVLTILSMFLQYVPIAFSTKRRVTAEVDARKFINRSHAMMVATAAYGTVLHLFADRALADVQPLLGLPAAGAASLLWLLALSRMGWFELPSPIARRLPLGLGGPAASD